MNHVMLDIETLGSAPGSVILSIAAVRFDETAIGETFYEVVDPASCVAAGMTIDPATVVWWMQQSEPARAAVCKSGDHIEIVLQKFARFLNPPEADFSASFAVSAVWGDGATFDNVLLSEAYRAVALPRPWSHRVDRCFRTVKALFPVDPPEFAGVKHNPVDDAKHQIQHLQAIVAKYGFRLL